MASHEPPVRLVFALHFHQPYGNLDEVFADACERCYLPTLELLAEHPHVTTAIHVSGPLLDWCEKHCKALIDKLAQLVARGQVELLGGGYQEPMLAILPDCDAIGQLKRMTARCEQLVGARPRGMWLAERVWEPDLARVIKAGGYRYTLLDDTHLYAAGAAAPLGSYYVTDKAGASVAVFPIDRGLRQRIPFSSTDELFDYLRRHPGRTLTYGDDAEKFGLWPTTDKRVWQDRWLERLLSGLLEHQSWLSTTTPSRVLAEQDAAGRVYIPTISYAEMGAWALPARSSREFVQLAHRLDVAGFSAESALYVRGGIWQGFLAKYPESNLIYRKMLRVSQAVERARQDNPEAKATKRARDALFRGQCNCAYWHGLFGGLYLQHLRAALMSTLLEAEQLVAPQQDVVVERCDYAGNLEQDVALEGPEFDLYLTRRGGRALSVDLCRARFHLTGVLGRRREAYHDDVSRAQVISDEELGNVSAHDLIRATEANLSDKLVFDAYPRGAFIDHLLPHDMTADAFDHDYRAVVACHQHNYELGDIVSANDVVTVPMSLTRAGVTLTKTYEVHRGQIHVHHDLTAAVDVDICFASQFDLTLLSPDGVGGRRITVAGTSGDAPTSEPSGTAERASVIVETPPGARIDHPQVRTVRVACADLGVDITLACSPAAALWRLPIETVSQSERGFESSYQGTAFVFVWRCRLGQQPQRFTLSLDVTP